MTDILDQTSWRVCCDSELLSKNESMCCCVALLDEDTLHNVEIIPNKNCVRVCVRACVRVRARVRECVCARAICVIYHVAKQLT